MRFSTQIRSVMFPKFSQRAKMKSMDLRFEPEVDVPDCSWLSWLSWRLSNPGVTLRSDLCRLSCRSMSYAHDRTFEMHKLPPPPTPRNHQQR